MFVASVKFSVIVFVCFLSYRKRAEAVADVCGRKGLCITVNDEKSPVTTYNYTKKTDVNVVCHFEEKFKKNLTFTLLWMKGKDEAAIHKCNDCRILNNSIHLSPDTNNRVYTCVRQVKKNVLDPVSTSIMFRDISDQSNTDQDADYDKRTTKIPSFSEETQVTPKESLTTKAEDKYNGQSKSFLESNWIVLTAVVIISIVAFIVTYVVFKFKKTPKEDKRRLNPKGSIDDIQDISKDQNTTHSEPKLNNVYTDPKSDTTSEEYCSPYMAMYSQPIPKHIRNRNEDKRRLNPKGSGDDTQDISKDQNIKHTDPKLNDFYTDPKSGTTTEEYCSPYIATYSQPIPKRLRNPNTQPKLKPKQKPTSTENYSNTCGLVYDEPTTYNNIAKNTGTMYHNVNKNTGTYDEINKSLKNIERVDFIDNMASSYSNTGSEIYINNPDVYSDPELYEVPY